MPAATWPRNTGPMVEYQKQKKDRAAIAWLTSRGYRVADRVIELPQTESVKSNAE